MAREHLKRCFTLLLCRGMHIETTMRYHYTPTRMAVNHKNRKYRMLLRLWTNWNTYRWQEGVFKSATTLEHSLAAS